MYPTFGQANIVTGIENKTIGTVTFSGENSRQRILVEENNELRVKELGGYSNLRLMGFTDSDYKKLINGGMLPRKISALAGNSIVVQTLEEIFKCILGAEND